MGSSKNKWKIITFSSRTPPCSDLKIKHQHPPKEFICPISNSLMSDPVIITSGQTFERNCIQLCKNLNFTPVLSDGSLPDFSTVIPNIAIKSTILNWCDHNKVNRPTPISLNVAEKLVNSLMAAQQVKSESGSDRKASHFRFSSEESIASSSSSLIEDKDAINEEEKIFVKLRSCLATQQEEGVSYLRQITRTDPTTRAPLCTPRLLSALRSLLISRISALQVNSIAALVNLSLEMGNKVKIVRSGLIPDLVEGLNHGFPESVEYSVSLLFSLSLDDQNKIAIVVLGALPPLVNLVKSENLRVKNESVYTLYHLSLVQTNRSKMVKLGAVPILLGLVKSAKMENLIACVLRILRNLAMCTEGRTVMLEVNAVKSLIELMKKDELESVSKEKCVETLFELSYGSMRFRGLAKNAGAIEALSEVVERGSEKVEEKAKKMLVMIQEDVMEKDEFENVDWEDLLMDSEVVTRSHFRLGFGLDSVENSV
ncbi:hypothetical protein ACHQM5_008456 [Ranunculus cassubicifolius]